MLDLSVLQWSLSASLDSGWLPEDLQPATLGSGPLAETAFDDLLNAVGLGVFCLEPETDLLVIGRSEWVSTDLDRLLDWRAGQELRAYSQELFIAYLLTGVDPLDEPADVLIQLGAGHPALEFLQQGGFDWPTTTVVPAREPTGDHGFGDWPKTGFLGFLGYRTGRSGLPDAHRRQLLDRAFRNSLPVGLAREYSADWGSPGTARRLQKIADSIAAFCRNHKRRQNASQQAIDDWEADLAWLKDRYFKGHFRFQWPSTYIRR